MTEQTGTSERLTVAVKPGVSAKLVDLAGSRRKQGEYLSGLIEAIWRNEQVPGAPEQDAEALRLQVVGLAATVKLLEARLEARLGRVEQQVAASNRQFAPILLPSGPDQEA